MLCIVSLYLIIIPVDAQIISVDLSNSNHTLKPLPTGIQIILSGKDSTYSQTFGVSGDHFHCILDTIQSGPYGMHLQLLNNQDIILEGFGRSYVYVFDTTFVKSYITSVRDSLYLVVDWEKSPDSKPGRP